MLTANAATPESPVRAGAGSRGTSRGGLSCRYAPRPWRERLLVVLVEFDLVEGETLATAAARQANDRAGLEPRAIDVIIYATLSPDFNFQSKRHGSCAGSAARM